MSFIHKPRGKKRQLRKEIIPVDFNKNEFPVEDDDVLLFEKMERVAKKRTHRLIFVAADPHERTTLIDALAAAYIQGMHDAVNS